MYFTLVKFVQIMTLALIFERISKARKEDASLNVEFDPLSWVQLILILLVNAFVLTSPPEGPDADQMLFFAQILVIINIFYLRRIVLFGNKKIYIREHSFNVSDITDLRFQGVRLSMKIKGIEVKVFLPLTHRKKFKERFSGKQFY